MLTAFGLIHKFISLYFEYFVQNNSEPLWRQLGVRSNDNNVGLIDPCIARTESH